jgi:orotate phosphoribosyltransferase
MKDHVKEISAFLAENGAIFFAPGLRLKDGRPTPYFVNLGRINTGRLAYELAGFFAAMLTEEGLVNRGDLLIGPSYKASALAALTSARLWTEDQIEVAFDYDRKEAKAHGEATGAKSLFVTGAIKTAPRALIIDDVATSMATKIELIDKIRAERPDIKLTAVVIAVDREQTQPVYDEAGRLVEGVKGEDAIQSFTAATGIPVRAVAPIREVIAHLFAAQIPVKIGQEMRPLSAAEKKAFDDYLELYGR